VVSGPTHGSVTITDPARALHYKPAANYNGSDSLPTRPATDAADST